MNPQHREPAAESGKGGSQRTPRTYVCGAWEIDCRRREVRARGTTVPLGRRAFEIVEMLVQSGGELVTKDDLMARVWSRAIVEENTLHFHISAIRKALGADRDLLKTVSGRGYRLSGAWTIREEKPADEHRAGEPARTPTHPFLTNVPVAAAALIGRADAVQHLQDLLSADRVVTLTGPGGIGKTVLAAEVARRLFPVIEGDVFLVELASLSDPDLVPSAVASTMGLKLGGDEISPESVARIIENKKLLLVIDNCEHVIDAAARVVETVLRLCPRVTILATSREALRVDGERVYQVAPLDVPLPQQVDPPEVLEHSAVQLFIARTKSLRADFSAGTENLPAIAAICRRLDGIPLAIEFAAARAATLSVRQIAERLHDRFALFTEGRRTALPRQQTLRAALDWSYELLPESERSLLRRFAIFPAGFTLEAAAALIGDSESSVLLGVSNLVSKSLVTLGWSGSHRRWYLLETIRAYALEKLDASGERDGLARRHIEYYRDLFERADREALARPPGEWLADYACEIDNLRAAVDWAFSSGGDAAVGVALTAVALPLWMYLSLMQECRGRVERALAALATAAARDARHEMKLYATLGASLQHTGAPASAIEAAWLKTLQIAKSRGDVDYQLRALWGLYNLSHRQSLLLAEQFKSLAAGPTDHLMADLMVGVSYHFQGNQKIARRHIERALAGEASQYADSHPFRFLTDPRWAARTFLARIQWLQGFAEQASETAASTVFQAQATGHAVSLCQVLARGACPIALETGDLDVAQRYIDLLCETSRKHKLAVWHGFGRALQGVLAIRRGDTEAGLAQLQGAIEGFSAAFIGYRVLVFFAELAQALGRAGRIPEGLATLDKAIDRSEQTAEGWIRPELLRIRGELLLLQGGHRAAVEAEDQFRRALDTAREQGSLAWELRAATSLAGLHKARSRPDEAMACLRPVYDRFTEGFDTADLTEAKRLLDELGDADRRVLGT